VIASFFLKLMNHDVYPPLRWLMHDISHKQFILSLNILRTTTILYANVIITTFLSLTAHTYSIERDHCLSEYYIVTTIAATISSLSVAKPWF
jgi:heme/copper-type cytochrome/quinol oxidase subunit 1